MQSDTTMSLSPINSDKPVEVTIRDLKVAHNDDADDSSILITGVEKNSEEKIKILLTPELTLNVLKFDNEKIFPECDSNSLTISTENNRYKLAKIMLHQKILIDNKYLTLSFPHPVSEIFPQIFLEFDADPTKSSREYYTLIRSMLQKGFINITAMVFKSFNKNKQILHECIFFNTEHCKMTKLNVEIVKLLFGCKADVNKMDQYNQTLLHNALNDREILHLYLKKKVPKIVNALKDVDNKFIHPTVQCIKTLVNLQTRINDIDSYKRTAIYVAVKEDDFESAKIILTRNPDLNIQCCNGFTPLHRAVLNRNLEMVKMLLEKNPNIHIEDVGCRTPLCQSLKKSLVFDSDDNNENRQKIIETFLNNGANPNVEAVHKGTLLNWACKSRDLFAVKMLLKHNVKINLKNKDGRNPLHDIIHLEIFGNDYNVESRLEYAKILIENGADVNSVDKNGETPLHSAVKVYDAFRIIEFLLKNKARVNIKSNRGTTPLHYACRTKNLEIIKILINYKADMSIRDDKGRTPLHYVAWAGYQGSSNDREAELKSIIDLLITKIDINDKDKEGKTPLHTACEHDKQDIEQGYVSGYLKNHELIALTLIKCGASINAVDKAGRTPLFYAVGADFFRLMEILIKNGADINILDETNESPIKLYIDELNVNEDNEILFSGSVIQPFLEHVIKLNTAKIYVCQQNLDIVFDDSDSRNTKWVEEYQKSCVVELDRLKSTKVSHSEMNFYEFLTETIDDKVSMMKNSDLKRSLSSDEFVKKFPIYANVLRCHFSEALK